MNIHMDINIDYQKFARKFFELHPRKIKVII